MNQLNKQPDKNEITPPPEITLEDVTPMGDPTEYPAKHLLELMEKRKRTLNEIYRESYPGSIGLTGE